MSGWMKEIWHLQLLNVGAWTTCTHVFLTLMTVFLPTTACSVILNKGGKISRQKNE